MQKWQKKPRMRIHPADWELFKSEYLETIKGYQIYKVDKALFIQVKSGEYFGYRNYKQLLRALDVLPERPIKP